MTEQIPAHTDSLAAAATTPVALATDLWTAGSILGAFLVLALLVRLLWMRLLRPVVRRSATDLDDLLLPPLRVLTLWGLVLIGLHQAATSLEAVQERLQVLRLIDRTLAIAGVVLVLATALRLYNRLVPWWAQRVTERSAEHRDLSHQAMLVRRIGNVLLAALGLLYLLRMTGIDISPLLAGGAIGGLAVALAMQDTLSNLFGGFFLTLDRTVRVGDFVRLESGEEGFVDQIGWRNTKVRLLANNLVIIPNSKLSQSVITNHFLPEPAVNVYVACGVSYDSDLQRVEEVSLEVAGQVLQRVEGADTTWQPLVRWKEFGDFAITFVVVLRVRDFNAQYVLRSEFVKALHRRFGQEQIEIPFPIRTVMLRQPAAG